MFFLSAKVNFLLIMSSIMEVDPIAVPDPTENQVINEQAYDFVIQTVYEKCKKEKENKKLTFPLNANDIRVSYYTGVPLSYLERFYSTEEAEEVEFPLDISVRKKLYQLLKDNYKSRILPTLEDINTEMQSQLSATDLQKMLIAMGFEYRKTSLGHLTLVESPDIAAQRFEYLSRITKLRKSQKTVYFVDEAYVSNKLEFLKVVPAAMNTADRELVDAYTFYYVVCQKGLVNALFCNHRDVDNFEKWFTNTILKALEPSSVVVLVRSYEPSKPISRYTAKEEIIKVLKANDVPHRADMHKSQLYELVVKFKLQDVHQNTFEEVIKTRGHQALYLPRPLYDLTIGELALNLLKDTVDIKQTDTLCEIKNKVLNFFDNVSPNLWTIFSTKIEKLENELLKIEVETDRALDSIE